jgi:RNA polymerase sigma-70 factor (ECF subfamily)
MKAGVDHVVTRDCRQQFEQVALVHLDDLFRMAVRLHKNRADAQDLVQETYFRAFKHFDQFQPGTNCRAWLFAILHNTFVNRLRRGGREVLELDGGDPDRHEDGPLEVMATIADPEEEFFKHVVDADLIKAIERLPLRFREIILLADVEEYSYKEIAQICGVPIGTVMSRLFRGRQRLRKALVAAYRERTERGAARDL